jgi:hypothetical protein
VLVGDRGENGRIVDPRKYLCSNVMATATTLSVLSLSLSLSILSFLLFLFVEHTAAVPALSRLRRGQSTAKFSRSTTPLALATRSRSGAATGTVCTWNQ